MTPAWEPIINVNEPKAARDIFTEIRDQIGQSNLLRISLDAQMDEARKLLALADALILTAFRHFGGAELSQWRERYARFLSDAEETQQ